MYKILITSRSFGEHSEEAKEILNKAGITYGYYNKKFEEIVFKEIIKKYDGLIIGAHKLSKEAVDGAVKLKVVCKHGSGLDNIDLAYMEKRNIRVFSAKGTNANAVADLAFALILDVSRKVSLGDRKVREGKWPKLMGVDAYGKTMGIIGFGAIGQSLAKRAAGFSMKVLVNDEYLDAVGAEFSDFCRLVTFDQLIKESDIISLHVPLTEKTKNLINKKELLKMKKNAILINTSRGGIVNENDLVEAINTGEIRGAGLDVLESEPLSKDNLILKQDGIVLTPHIGMYSIEATNAVSVICAKQIAEFFLQ